MINNMNTIIKKHSRLLRLMAGAVAVVFAFSSCSDDAMERLNTDSSKASSIDPNAQLTTALLQTYGDFSLMDTYRSYISGFTQQFAGGWNVTNYAGSVHADNDQESLAWSRYYSISIKNLVDAISKTADLPNVNAALRIQRVYLLSLLTDIYGDVPATEAGKAYTNGIANPRYDKQQDIYSFFFDELDSCENQLGTGSDKITGDVTSLAGNVSKWKKYANALRMRFAMRISDVDPEKAEQEFEKAYNSPDGYIASADDDAYVKYLNKPFTLYEGARKYDFRVNAFSEILYGQDATSPSFICSTFFNLLKDNNDPRLYRICRHYINTARSNITPSSDGNIDVTDEVVAYLKRNNMEESPCNPGAAWYDNWVSAPANSEIPTLDSLVRNNPSVGYDANNAPARMMRPFLSIDFEQPDNPGILITSAEVNFLLAEAKTRGWKISGSAEDYYENGIRQSMELLNNLYLTSNKISDTEINTFIAAHHLGSNPKEDINTQAWILHLTNPSEAWANLRRSDYPVLMDRSKLGTFDGFTYDDSNLLTPVRLQYPSLESRYNKSNYEDAIQRLGGTDNWHQRMWWDTKDGNFK